MCQRTVTGHFKPTKDKNRPTTLDGQDCVAFMQPAIMTVQEPQGSVEQQKHNKQAFEKVPISIM